jgi:hypothetical protein
MLMTSAFILCPTQLAASIVECSGIPDAPSVVHLAVPTPTTTTQGRNQTSHRGGVEAAGRKTEWSSLKIRLHLVTTWQHPSSGRHPPHRHE